MQDLTNSVQLGIRKTFHGTDVLAGIAVDVFYERGLSKRSIGQDKQGPVHDEVWIDLEKVSTNLDWLRIDLDMKSTDLNFGYIDLKKVHSDRVKTFTVLDEVSINLV